MYPVNTIIDFFLSHESMSPKKLQKLLYYAYAWTLALLNDSPEELDFRLFNERFEAWVHGPVIRNVYRKYKDYGWSPIPMQKDFDDSCLSDDVLDILNQVWDVYGKYTSDQLEAITHRETPWIEARGNLPAFEPSSVTISDTTIFKFYNSEAAEDGQEG